MKQTSFRGLVALFAAFALIVSAPGVGWAGNGGGKGGNAADFATTTPIKYVVVIFNENISFDHYFGTYPHAQNNPGETPFHAKDDTPRVNNLESAGLLTQNNNTNSGTQVNPFRIPPANAVTCDNDHDYNDEQFAFHSGLMDQWLTPLTALGETGTVSCVDPNLGPNTAMGYYDGNTVAAMWNYAQHFALSDNSYGTTFGPSSTGAVNLISGNIFEATIFPTTAAGTTPNAGGEVAGANLSSSVTQGALIGDARPHLDDCVQTTKGLAHATQVTMSGKNIGDLLNNKSITWGWFQGGFAPTGANAAGLAICGQHHVGLAGDDALTQSSDGDYIPHHEPFQYYASTANVHHTRPSDAGLIGTSSDGANHQYDTIDFTTALNEGRLPAVSFIKAPAYQDAHPGYSDPIDEQFFTVNLINMIMQTDEWKHTLVVIAYDDSDGWYDHQMGPIVNQSDSPGDDQLLTPGVSSGSCGTPKPQADANGQIQNGRCGYGPRLPMLLISPYSKQNYVDHRLTDQSSIIRFIEDNWSLGRIGNGSTDAIAGRLDGMLDFRGHASRLILDPSTGLVVSNPE
ncbi:MAG TPA: alkaline phosphatase family protein [Candidatus Sulfotelmatobacter sp.]|nr:alkaline phosphatase family protein [Candidatus Sulfotelmatobacter sp.]